MRVRAKSLVWLVRKATAGGGENALVAKNLQHLQQVNPGLDQVGCIAVAKAVGGDLFFSPQETAT